MCRPPSLIQPRQQNHRRDKTMASNEDRRLGNSSSSSSMLRRRSSSSSPSERSSLRGWLSCSEDEVLASRRLVRWSHPTTVHPSSLAQVSGSPHPRRVRRRRRPVPNRHGNHEPHPSKRNSRGLPPVFDCDFDSAFPTTDTMSSSSFSSVSFSSFGSQAWKSGTATSATERKDEEILYDLII